MADIGKEIETVEVEPLPVKIPAEPTPAKEPEKVPA